jgi:cytochrome c-type biogenesis protein CcmF
MIPELGHFALILATVVALIQGVLPLTGTYLPSRTLQITLQSLARPMAIIAMCFGGIVRLRALATALLNE